jgi:hypothetical protein
MAKWWKDRLIKWLIDETASRLAQVDEVASWQKSKLMKLQVDKIVNWWNCNLMKLYLMKLQVDKIVNGWNCKLMK